MLFLRNETKRNETIQTSSNNIISLRIGIELKVRRFLVQAGLSAFLAKPCRSFNTCVCVVCVCVEGAA